MRVTAWDGESKVGEKAIEIRQVDGGGDEEKQHASIRDEDCPISLHTPEEASLAIVVWPPNENRGRFYDAGALGEHFVTVGETRNPLLQGVRFSTQSKVTAHPDIPVGKKNEMSRYAATIMQDWIQRGERPDNTINEIRRQMRLLPAANGAILPSRDYTAIKCITFLSLALFGVCSGGAWYIIRGLTANFVQNGFLPALGTCFAAHAQGFGNAEAVTGNRITFRGRCESGVHDKQRCIYDYVAPETLSSVDVYSYEEFEWPAFMAIVGVSMAAFGLAYSAFLGGGPLYLRKQLGCLLFGALMIGITVLGTDSDYLLNPNGISVAQDYSCLWTSSRSFITEAAGYLKVGEILGSRLGDCYAHTYGILPVGASPDVVRAAWNVTDRVACFGANTPAWVAGIAAQLLQINYDGNGDGGQLRSTWFKALFSVYGVMIFPTCVVYLGFALKSYLQPRRAQAGGAADGEFITDNNPLHFLHAQVRAVVQPPVVTVVDDTGDTNDLHWSLPGAHVP